MQLGQEEGNLSFNIKADPDAGEIPVKTIALQGLQHLVSNKNFIKNLTFKYNVKQEPMEA